jgi:hypothetical protein
MGIFQQESGNVLLLSMSVDLRTKPRLKHLPAVCSTRWLVVTIGLMLPSMFGQTELPIRGTVVTKDGQPIAGVMVYGSMSKNCCPFKREQTTTDEEGQFRLEHPGAVIHFWKDNLQPQALVVGPGTSEVRMTMEPSTESLVVPACGKPGPGQKQIGWGKYGLRFRVPKRAVKILGGKTNTDYVRYVIKPKTGEAHLELWFGPYAMESDPDNDLVINSVNFAQRNVVDANGGVAGKDSWGNLRSEGSWRQTAVSTQGGSIYRNARPQDATLFDQIVNSICLVPYPIR